LKQMIANPAATLRRHQVPTVSEKRA